MTLASDFDTAAGAPTGPSPSGGLEVPARDASDRSLFHALLRGVGYGDEGNEGDAAIRRRSSTWLQARSDACRALPAADSGLPDDPATLAAWLRQRNDATGALYQQYLASRRAGAPRRFFSNRAHALYFLRNVAPTKLVDGAWLHGVLPHWQNPRFADLVRIYLEELGDGRADRNHVLLYRRLLAAHGLEGWDEGQPDAHYTQGALQLALAAHTADWLPEIIGFNLGYEQLPLHLPITAFELDELGIDPTYFSLHVTVDNAHTGHARRAVDAVLAALPLVADSGDFYRRVGEGYRLNDLGAGTTEVIAGFDIQAEVERIFTAKSAAGSRAHSDYCRVAGRTVNEWLAEPSQVPDFLRALEAAGWIERNAPPAQSRLWRLLQGERAEMFGVFSGYELQVIQDWLRGPVASADGAPVDGTGALATSGAPGAISSAKDKTAPATAFKKPRSYRVQHRLDQARAPAASAGMDLRSMLDPDVEAFEAQLARAADADALAQLLIEAIAPHRHWMPAGLLATRRFVKLTTGHAG